MASSDAPVGHSSLAFSERLSIFAKSGGLDLDLIRIHCGIKTYRCGCGINTIDMRHGPNTRRTFGIGMLVLLLLLLLEMLGTLYNVCSRGRSAAPP